MDFKLQAVGCTEYQVLNKQKKPDRHYTFPETIEELNEQMLESMDRQQQQNRLLQKKIEIGFLKNQSA
jgi:hypothetical protein